MQHRVYCRSLHHIVEAPSMCNSFSYQHAPRPSAMMMSTGSVLGITLQHSRGFKQTNIPIQYEGMCLAQDRYKAEHLHQQRPGLFPRGWQSGPRGGRSRAAAPVCRSHAPQSAPPPHGCPPAAPPPSACQARDPPLQNTQHKLTIRLTEPRCSVIAPLRLVVYQRKLAHIDNSKSHID